MGSGEALRNMLEDQRMHIMFICWPAGAGQGGEQVADSILAAVGSRLFEPRGLLGVMRRSLAPGVAVPRWAAMPVLLDLPIMFRLGEGLYRRIPHFGPSLKEGLKGGAWVRL